MGVLQPQRRLADVVARLGHAEPPRQLYQLPQVGPLDVLQREEVPVFRQIDVEGLHNVGVGELGDDKRKRKPHREA